jgi:hypothetical protein
MIAIALLTLKPRRELIDFYKNISNGNYDFYCIVDDNNFIINPIDDNVNYIQINDHFCVKNGFHGFNPAIRKKNAPLVSAWDKAIFYFCRHNRSYDHIWFIEDDVFVPDLNLFQTIDSQYQNADIISSKVGFNLTGDLNGWHWWKMASRSNIPLPWACSMVCAFRSSKILLQLLDRHVDKNRNRYKFIEYIFHTLAIHNKLIIKQADNLSEIAYRKNWSKEEFNLKTFYHPIKSIEQQVLLREHLNKKYTTPTTPNALLNTPKVIKAI